MGVICAHEDVLVVQLPAPRGQGSPEWDLWSDGAGGLQLLPQLGWVVECFLKKDFYWGSSPGWEGQAWWRQDWQHSAYPEMLPEIA